MPFEFLPLVLFPIVVVLGVRVVRDSQRLAVHRLGRYIGLRGPGLVLLIPVVDRATVIELDAAVPQWRSLSPELLDEQVRRHLHRSV